MVATATKSKGKAQRRLTREMAQLEFAQSLVSDIKEIGVELIKASQTNPLVGVAVAAISVNMARKLKLIDQSVENVLLTFIAAAGGISIVDELLGDIPFIGKGTGSPQLIMPTAQTFTRADSAPSKEETGNKTADQMVAAGLGLVSKVAAAAA